MSIVRIGMSEDDKFGNGYDAIFGKSKKKATLPVAAKPASTAPIPKKPISKKSAVKKK